MIVLVDLPTPVAIGFMLVFGLLIGSFLNTVIHRLPMMIERNERQESLRTLHIATPNLETFNLGWPRSRCPNCHSQILIRHLLPIVSWFYLRGRCKVCKQSISIRYPLVEALTALLAVWLFLEHGLSFEFVFKFFFCCVLLAAAVIDWESGWLPHLLTVPLIGGGLLFSVIAPYDAHSVSPSDSIIGLVVGFTFLWLLNYIYRALLHREGIGYGDFMLVGAFGAWFGWVFLPLILVIASVLSLVMGLVLLARGQYDAQEGVRFGPFLAFTGITAMLGRDLGWFASYF